MVIPVASAISTRSDVRCARKAGRTRSGLDATLSSSKLEHVAKPGGSAPRKLAEMSSAKRVNDICGKAEVRKAGTALGVVEEPTRR